MKTGPHRSLSLVVKQSPDPAGLGERYRVLSIKIDYGLLREPGLRKPLRLQVGKSTGSELVNRVC